MINITDLKTALETKNAETIARYIKINNLKLVDNKLYADNQTINDSVEYYDKRQLVRKILLNSALIPSAIV